MNLFLSFCLASSYFYLSELSQLEMTTPETQRIYFVRHGESELNQLNKMNKKEGKNIVGGQNVNIKLTPIGQQQAIDLGQMLKAKLAKTEKVTVLSSNAVRAQETAQLIFQQLKENGFKVELSDQSYEGLCEICMGQGEGKLETEEFQLAKMHWHKNLSAKEKFFTSIVPYDNKAESCHQVVKRAFKDLEAILQAHVNETLIIVSHKGTLNAIALQLSSQLNELSEEPGTLLPDLNLNNCDMLMVEIPKAGSIDQAQVKMHIQYLES